MAENENKHDKFKRIATKRVQNVVKDIEKIRNLSKSSYEYTEEEVEKMFAAMQETLDDVKASFSGTKIKAKEFSL